MFDSTLNPVDGLVLPALEATYMVTSVEDSDPCQKSEETISSARARKPSSLQIPKSPKHNSKWRAGRILSWIVPPLLGLFILYGWQFGSSNIVLFHLFLTLTVGLFIFLWIAPNHHSAPPSAVPKLISESLIPHQVSSPEGGYIECWQDHCQGRVLPPRARHCKDCRKCRLDFDHHCPWLGCIARDTMKSFILFLAFATIAIIVGLAPVYRLVWKQIKLVTGLLWEDEWMYREWWNSKWSWVGGPVTRYGGAVVISYLYYDVPASMKSQDNPTGEFPISLTLLFYSFYGTLLGIFCVIMCFGALQDVIRASSTIEATRSNKQKKAGVKHLYWYRYIQMPRIQSMSAEHGDSKASRVQEIPATVKLYDFGVVENLKRVFGRTSREWFSPWPPRVEPIEHWQLGPRALAYLDMPTDQKQTDRKVD